MYKWLVVKWKMDSLNEWICRSFSEGFPIIEFGKGNLTLSGSLFGATAASTTMGKPHLCICCIQHAGTCLPDAKSSFHSMSCTGQLTEQDTTSYSMTSIQIRIRK